MTNDIVALIDFYERERAISRENIVSTLEFAFLAAYRKMVKGADKLTSLKAGIDTKRGNVSIYALLTVVEDGAVQDPQNEVSISLALKKLSNPKVGEEVEIDITPKNFGRIAIQTARQTIMQRLREAERSMIYETFKDRAGDIVNATIRRFDRNDIWVDLGQFEGKIPAREKVPTEDYNVGDRLRVYVVEVNNESRGAEIVLSRSHPNFIRRLFEAEITEVADKTIEIVGLSRKAGYRTKIAVKTNDPKVDPVGACVGIRGDRIRNIICELNQEKIDIIHWVEDPEEFVIQIFKPIQICSIELEEKDKVMRLMIKEDDLSKAIGRGGQNARLASHLIGWDIQISKDSSQEEQFESRIADASSDLASELGITSDLASALFRAGGTTLDMVVEMPAEYLQEVLEVPLEEAELVIKRAKAALAED